MPRVAQRSRNTAVDSIVPAPDIVGGLHVQADDVAVLLPHPHHPPPAGWLEGARTEINNMCGHSSACEAGISSARQLPLTEQTNMSLWLELISQTINELESHQLNDELESHQLTS